MTLKISRILHAGYVFECDGTLIAFDPIFENPFSRNCHAFPDVRFDHARIRGMKPDAVFISHFHDDHCSLESLDLLDRTTPIHLYCLFDELFALIRELGFVNVLRLEVDAPVRVGAIEVIPRRALDADVDSMFHIRAAGLNVLNVVDSWMDPETLEQLKPYAPWDMVLWPFQTMREIDVIAPSRAQGVAPALPEEWPEQLRALAPRYVVPSSCQFVQEPWSWYNHALFPITYRQFGREVGAWLPDAAIVRLNPSVSVELTPQGLAPSAPLSWVLPVGEQDVDYEYDADIVPPPTSDIARHFAPLDAGQTALALDYCRSGLLEKYEDMELPSDSYFATPCIWQLSVYDHEGAVRQFRYRVHGDRIALTGDEEAPTWMTEIPIAKLYAGLALGESLTSMYMRINGAPPDADIVDDPLIRCLFNDAFGAYQSAQLQRIKERAAQ
ncbi:MBL fold metallo-hydrolase [Duganella sp. BJB488]|uniref:MBL fold metallo-hydrolase n=1 Tax=unclassified Duganella TaxID=2636909 RepID=UPI000E355CE0|nr:MULTISPECIES: MBL fold metallo-hydrolase [unclassified Duganella]RFP12465.1 MBL fold metallo-hydrolase [Duganella sp. BJB489]RFP16445.1 MBL fold metallo-hydrolase [Duganella sp. BJB488]RFP30829.1 MBL fold metallo-hydrolase [Duganella sp. BJB480]